jgi:hypothetical protein
MMLRRILFRVILLISLGANIYFLFGILITSTNLPSYKFGVLTRDIEVGEFASGNVLFTLPAGLTVRDVSPRGINGVGWLEPYMYQIVVTSRYRDLVDFDEDKIQYFGHFYSTSSRLFQPSDEPLIFRSNADE